jgi:hypothetical protein
MLCVDAEVLKQPPVTSPIPLVAEKHDIVKQRDKCRVYLLTLEPGDSCTVTYPFFYLTVILEPGIVEREIGPIKWRESDPCGAVAWKEPVMNQTIRNVGETSFQQFIAEWR